MQLTIEEYFLKNRRRRFMGNRRFDDIRMLFEERGIRTIKRLLSEYDSLPHDAKFVSLLYFADCEARTATTLCFREIGSPGGTLAGVAGYVLSCVGGNAVMARLLRMLTGNPPYGVTANVISALGWIKRVDDPSLIVTEMTRVCRDSEDSWLITLAIEALYHCNAELNPTRKLEREIIKCLGDCLYHTDPEVQGVAAHSLGELREARYLKRLEELAISAQGEVRGWGPVKRLAREAVCKIKSGSKRL